MSARTICANCGAPFSPPVGLYGTNDCACFACRDKPGGPCYRSVLDAATMAQVQEALERVAVELGTRPSLVADAILRTGRSTVLERVHSVVIGWRRRLDAKDSAQESEAIVGDLEEALRG